MPITPIESKTRGVRYVAKYQGEHLGTFDSMEQAQDALTRRGGVRAYVKSSECFYKEKPSTLPLCVYAYKLEDGYKLIVDFIDKTGRRRRKGGFLTVQEAKKWRDQRGYDPDAPRRKKSKSLNDYPIGSVFKGATIMKKIKEGNRLDQNRVFFVCECGRQGNKKWGTMLAQTRVKCSKCMPVGRRKLWP